MAESSSGTNWFVPQSWGAEEPHFLARWAERGKHKFQWTPLSRCFELETTRERTEQGVASSKGCAGMGRIMESQNILS